MPFYILYTNMEQMIAKLLKANWLNVDDYTRQQVHEIYNWLATILFVAGAKELEAIWQALVSMSDMQSEARQDILDELEDKTA